MTYLDMSVLNGILIPFTGYTDQKEEKRNACKIPVIKFEADIRELQLSIYNNV